MTRIFVYGTLKRGCCNHHYLHEQDFVCEARTESLYRLYNLGGYPGMVRDKEAGLSVTGEIWDVNEEALERLDELEGLAAGEYRRVLIPLQAPHHEWQVQGYEYLRDVTAVPEIGGCWTET